MKKNKKLVSLPHLVVFDFDGVMTNNKVIVSQDGTESVLCDRGDGLGIEMLRALGIPAFILSKEKNPVVAARGKKLKLEVIQGIDNKSSALKAYCSRRGISLKHVLYVGNDLNDMAVMKLVGCSACPRDAHPAVKRIASIKLSRNGGDGAVRELVETYLGGQYIEKK